MSCLADQVVKCRHVIITVPILALQKQTICFSPALPSQKMDAIARVKMSNAVKVRLQLKTTHAVEQEPLRMATADPV